MAGDAKGEYRGLAYRDEKALKAWLAKRPHEEALEPALPIIDPHHHFWDTPQRGRYLLPELLADTVKLPTIEDAVKAGGFLAGRPEDIVEQLKAVEKRYPGLDRVICATPLGTPLDVQLADLDRFAKEVIPAFRDTRTAAAAE